MKYVGVICTTTIMTVCAVLSLMLFVPLTHAATCSSSNEDRLERKYDDSIEDFEDEVESSEVEEKIRDIRLQMRRSSRSDDSSMIDRELRALKNAINDLEDIGDDLYDEYRSYTEGSRFDDCEDVADKYLRKLRKDTRSEINDLRDTYEDLEEMADNADSRSGVGRTGSRSQVRAPSFSALREGPASPQKNRDRESESTRPVNMDDTASAVNEERTAQEVRAEIVRLLSRVQHLLRELRTLRQQGS